MTPRTRNEDYDRARAVVVALLTPVYDDSRVNALTAEICRLVADARGEGYDEQGKIANEARVRLSYEHLEMLRQRERAEMAEAKLAHYEVQS